MRRSAAVVIAGLVLLGSAACSDDGPARSSRSAIQQHRDMWRRRNIATYSFTFTAGAMCGSGSVRVSVKEGVPGATTVLRGQCLTDDPPRTIEAVFSRVEEERAQWGAHMTVRYDASYGYPASLEVNDPSSSDEEHGFKVTAFRAGG
jgi:hypothetical protein